VPAFDASLIAAVGALALGASVFHLGRPLYAYRALIGLRHSWLSREILAFGAFMGLTVPYAVAVWLGWSVEWLGAAAAIAGIAGVACSVLIYTTTGRVPWTPLRVAARFVGGAAVAGVTTVAWAASLVGGSWLGAIALTLVLAGVVAGQLVERLRFFTTSSRPR
jgi:DMSO reductase anchor subunit